MPWIYPTETDNRARARKTDVIYPGLHLTSQQVFRGTRTQEAGCGGVGMSKAKYNTGPNSKNVQLDQIIAHRIAFLRFLSTRVESSTTAEDILHSAYLKALEHGSEIRDSDSTFAWFYRILRNAVIDHYRRSAARTRAHGEFANGSPESYDPELALTVCACVSDVVHDLKGEYRTALEQVDLGGNSVDAFARSEQISANNASVRLHRARRAVARQLTRICGACAEHKCLDCTCRRSQL